MQNIMKILALVSQIRELLQILDPFPVLIQLQSRGQYFYIFTSVRDRSLLLCAFCTVHNIAAICSAGNLTC